MKSLTKIAFAIGLAFSGVAAVAAFSGTMSAGQIETEVQQRVAAGETPEAIAAAAAAAGVDGASLVSAMVAQGVDPAPAVAAVVAAMPTQAATVVAAATTAAPAQADPAA